MYCITQKSQPDICNRQLIQHNVSMQRFISPQKTYIFDRNCDSQMAEESSSCTTSAVVDSFAFLCTMQAMCFDLAKVEVTHNLRIFAYNALGLSRASSNVSKFAAV